MYFCENKSPRTLSENIYNILKQRGVDGIPFKGARRPFDHYRPTESAWYIVPSSELPFFKFGKFYFEWENADSINCGVICTKGLASELAVVYPSKKGKRLIMEDESWAFYKWADICAQKKLFPVLQQIQNNLPEAELKLRFKGAYIDDPGLFDPYTEEKKAFDQYEIAVSPAENKLKVSRAVRQAMNLKILNQACNEVTFADAVSKIAADSFLWCDIFIGMTFKVAEAEVKVLTVEDIIDKFLAHLSIFVK